MEVKRGIGFKALSYLVLFSILQSPIFGHANPNCRVIPKRPPIINDTLTLSLWELLSKSEQLLQLKEEEKNVILLLGNTGSGKSTVTQLIAGNANALEVVENERGMPLVIDKEHKIGTTTASHTLIPDLVVDPETGLAIYDCPGFNDNRGANLDITVNYLLKKITDYISSVKLVFTIVYSNVNGINDKSDFNNLATSAVKMMKNVTVFESGIGLIATKAPNFDPANGKELGENELIQNVLTFLQVYKTDQENLLKVTQTKEKEVIQKKIDFVEVLLKPDHVNVMRFAHKCGPILSDKKIVDNRKNLKKLVKSKLNFTSSSPNDYGYALSDAGVLKVKDGIEDINTNITAQASIIIEKLGKAQREKMGIQEDFDYYTNFISEEITDFNQTFSELEEKRENLTPKEMGDKIKQVLSLKLYDISLGKKYYEEMTRLDNYLRFFNEIISKNNTQYSTWIEPFKTWLEDTGKIRDWADYLKGVRQRLGKYDFHLSKRITRVSEYPDLSSVANLTGQEADSRIKNIFSNSLTPKDEVYLRLILEEALDPVTVECRGDILKISGNYVKASDFTNEDGTYKCSNANTVHVFAARTFFMDINILPDKSKYHHLSIIAPVWEIVTPSTVAIDLNGKDGPSPPTKAQTGTAGTEEGQNGTPGLNGGPGYPGNAGGEFFAISNKIRNEGKLRIFANGGQGGNGQEGGNGADGTKGTAAKYENFVSCAKNVLYTTLSVFSEENFNENWWATTFLSRWILNYGEVGGKGGRGGDGGGKGLGGFPGDIQFLQLGEIQQIATEVKEGKLGGEGRFGIGGIGGERGNSYKALFWRALGILGCSYQFKIEVPSFGHRSENGPCGSTGANSNNRKNPEMPNFNLKKWKIVNDFKTFVVRKETRGLRNNFIQVLEESKPILDLSHPEAFAHELLNVEEYVLKLRHENKMEKAAILLMGRYESFIKRVEDYANNTKSLPWEDKKALAITYTTALSRKNSYANLLGTSVVINVEGYFQNVLNKFERMKDLSMRRIVDEERKQYASKFQDKIMQAMSFVKNVVHPGIDNLEIELAKTSNELLQEIEKILTEAIDSKAALDQMKSMMVFRHILSALKLVSAAISLTGPQGAAIGGIIGTTSSLSEIFLLENNMELRPQTPLSPAIKRFGDNLEFYAKIAYENNLKSIDVLAESGKKASSPADLNHFLENLKKQKDDLKNKQGAEYYLELQKIQATEQKINNQLDKKMTEYKKNSEDDSFTDTKKAIFKKKLESLQSIKSAVTTYAELGTEIYNNYKNDQSKLNQLEKMVLEAEKSVKSTKKYKEAINHILNPMINSISADIQRATESMSGKSSVGLQVQKWQVKQTLSDIKLFLQDFTEDLSVKDKFEHLVNHLTEAIVIMIELYDTIDKYNEQMNFADYLANINSPDALKIVIKNPEIVRYINMIELSLHSNIILSEYDLAIATFKQWVFPYGQFYNNDVKLPQEVPDFLKPESNITTVQQINLYLIPRLINRIDNLQQRIQQYKVGIFPSIDANLIFTNFNSDTRSTKPFYVWENNKNAETIKDFLSGEKVSFYADSDYSYKRGRSAVKFTIVEFQPKSNVLEIQANLTDILQDFAIEMTHSGVSHYSYDEKTIEMVGDNVTLRYNYERDPANNNMRVGQNAAYQKMRKGDLILSPYTVWTVQLLKAMPNSDISFHELVKLAQYVDLELVGRGSYVDETSYPMRINLETVVYMKPFISQPGNPYVLERHSNSTLRVT